MEERGLTVLIMAAGTGGHVFPALSIADVMREKSIHVEWLGTHHGLENRILKDTDIPLHKISVKGLRGGGIKKLITAPLMLLKSLLESWRVLGEVKPDFVLGMGGFVCGPAGLASRMRGIPLFIHEQNAVPGLTNKLLRPLARRVFEGFPDTFQSRSNVLFVGNPLRSTITTSSGTASRKRIAGEPLRLLVLGGSQGAKAINEVIPQLLASVGEELPLETMHQVGANHLDAAIEYYQSCELEPGEKNRLLPFIDDMAAAYRWADVVICRSGASTVSEIAAVGLPAIFIPYPYHKDEQQKLNAQWLVKEGAGLMIEQKDLSAERLITELSRFLTTPDLGEQMSQKARSLAVLDAGRKITEVCLEEIHAG